MPTNAEKPAPNRLSASPVAYWLVLSQMTSTPNAAASSAPASAPAPKAIQSLPVWNAVAKPAMAATSIIPSAPRLTMPGALVDEQAERREREHGARVERRGDEERELLHQVPSRAGNADEATTGLSGASSIAGAAGAPVREGVRRSR